MKHYIIDRFEGIYAICEQEDKTMISIRKNQLPSGVKEGDYIIRKEDGTFLIDANKRKIREEEIRKKMNDLFE